MQKTRRQFSIEIIKCDGFVSMPATAQLLYVHLAMSADDEGFTSQIETCKFHAHASDEDLQELVDREFIYLIGDKKRRVAVIKHWKLNNYIRDGKIVPSAFSERANVYVKPNGNYTLDEHEGTAICTPKGGQGYVKGTSKVHQGTVEVCPTCDGRARRRDNPTNPTNPSITSSIDSVIPTTQSNPTQRNPTNPTQSNAGDEEDPFAITEE